MIVPATLRGALLLVCLAALAGCSTAGSAPLAPAAEAPRPGGVLRMQLEEPGSLDPVRVDSVYASVPVNQLFDGLVSTDPALTLRPALATTWTISRDNRTYLFHLRRGVVFHDGSPFTADDVAHTIRRVLAPRSEPNIAATYLSVLEGAEDFTAGRRDDLPGVDVLDDHTVLIRLAQPYPSFLEVLAMDGLRIVPHRALLAAGEDAFWRRPVGSGPFRLARWDAQGLRLERHAGWFGTPAHLDAVEIRFPGSGTDGQAARFAAGELDLAELPSEHGLEAVERMRARVHRVQELDLTFLGINTSRPPLADARIRQAIAHAIDRDAIVADAPDGRRAAVGILPPGLPGYSPARKALAFDRHRARSLLAEAGHAGGRGLPPLELCTAGRTAGSARVLQALAADLGAVGLRVRTRHLSWPEMTERIDRGDAPLFVLGWVADLVDPDAFLRTLFEPGGSANYFRFEDAAAHALLQQGARATSPILRMRLYRELERTILARVPLVPLYHSRSLVVTRPEVRGVEPGPFGISGLDLERAWLADGARR